MFESKVIAVVGRTFMEHRDLNDLGKSALRHAAAIDAVIRGQIDPASAATLTDAGGGRALLASVRGLLAGLLATPGKRP